MPFLTLTFERVHDTWLINHSGGIPHDPDLWAYTPEMSSLIARFRRKFGRGSPAAICRRVVTLRKRRAYAKQRKKLTKFSRTDPSVRLGSEFFQLIRDFYAREGVGRDRYPRTARFERLYAEVRSAGGKCSRQVVWNTLYYLGKKGEAKGGLPRVGKRSHQ